AGHLLDRISLERVCQGVAAIDSRVRATNFDLDTWRLLGGDREVVALHESGSWLSWGLVAGGVGPATVEFHAFTEVDHLAMSPSGELLAGIVVEGDFAHLGVWRRRGWQEVRRLDLPLDRRPYRDQFVVGVLVDDGGRVLLLGEHAWVAAG